jgi:hypothetical protein
MNISMKDFGSHNRRSGESADLVVQRSLIVDFFHSWFPFDLCSVLLHLLDGFGDGAVGFHGGGIASARKSRPSG